MPNQDNYASDAVAITPSDSAVQRGLCAIYVGGAGDVAVKGKSGVAVTFKNVPAGTIIPISINFVMSTNTTATNITGFIA